jgi:transposase-like protein
VWTNEDRVVAAAASVEVERWRVELAEVMARIGHRFGRYEPRAHAAAAVSALVSGVHDPNCWTLAERAGHAGPDAMQHLLARARWDEDGVRDDLRNYVAEHLSSGVHPADRVGAVLVADETGDLKKGRHTLGVQRQYTGTAGRIDRRGQYPRELRERAVRLVAESRDQYESEWAAMSSIAAKLGIGTTETLRKWVRQAQVDDGARPGTTEESAELQRLKREVTTLRTYAAWVEQADRRAAETIAQVIPKPAPTPRVHGPYETIAAHLREKILTGELKPGDELPTIVQLAAQHTVAAGTAHRAVALLRTEGLVSAPARQARCCPPSHSMPGSRA